MGIFDGMNNAATGTGRRWLDTGGAYTIRVLKCGQMTAAESHKGVPSFFVELEVVQSGVKSCPAGTLASWVAPLKGDKTQRDASISNIKQFLAATIGVMAIFDTPDPVTGAKPSAEQFAEAVCSAAQPFAGRLVSVKVSNKLTRAGTDFSKHDWFPAS